MTEHIFHLRTPSTKREPNYAVTLANQLANFPHEIFVADDEDTSYLGEEFQKKIVRNGSWGTYKVSSQRAARNYHECLVYKRTKGSGILILEDDVVLSPRWEEALPFAWSILNVVLPKNLPYIVSLVNAQAESSFQLSSTDEFSLRRFQPRYSVKNNQLEIGAWVETAAAYYSDVLLKSDFPKFIKENSVKGFLRHDLAAGRYCYEHGVAVFLIEPMVAMNMGRVSASKDTLLEQSLAKESGALGYAIKK